MNESLIKYLAGLLDADGSLSFGFKQDVNRPDRWFVSLRLTLASSDAIDVHGFVDSLPSVTGLGGISRYGKSYQYKTWTISKRAHVEMIVPRLIKHMVIKARHWKWLLDTWREYRRTTCSVNEMEALKSKSRTSRFENAGSLKPKNHPSWAWLAGYLDGDGWYIYRYCPKNNYWAMRVGAVSHKNDADAVFPFLTKAFKGITRADGNKVIWTRNLGKRDRSFALAFLSKIARHSKLKRHKIDSMIHHHRQRLSVLGSKEQATV